MSPETNQKDSKICPTCGTKVSVTAERCVVCGTNLAVVSSATTEDAVRGSQMPKITLGLPAAIGMILLLVAIGALIVYLALGRQPASAAVAPTETPTITLTPTVTASPTPQTPTPTLTPEPSPTPLSYTVKLGDTCGGIAFAFNVSIQSIVLLNNLAADCNPLSEGQNLLIPHPTPTPTAQPTATLSGIAATIAACDKLDYTVQEKDTLGSIALNYQVPAEAIKQYNGLPNDIVIFGQQLIIPLCQRNATPGPTPTITPPPPYPAANLLLPAHGAPFSANDEIITLQWASVGTLRENEAYAVTIEDITAGQGKKLVDYVIDTKYIVPAGYQPTDNIPHIITWWVVPVRQIDTDDEGNPVWDVAGAVSDVRAFVWSGSVSATPAP